MKNKVLFLTLLMLLFGCSRNSKLDPLKKAEDEHQKGNIKRAIEIYTEFVRANPQNPRVPEVLFKLAQIYLNELKMPTKSTEFFNKIVEDYPKSKEAMKALFMIGFIYANELNDYEKAKIYYQKFLDLYPNSELAVSAKFEIENLGRKPEELVK